MNVKLLSIFITTIGTLIIGSSYLASKIGKIEIESIIIFADFQKRGYTTAGAYTHFADLKKKGVKQIEISLTDKQTLEKIIQESEKSRHHQTKFGGNLVFALVKFSEFKNASKVVLNIGKERVYIVDLSNMIQYKVTQSSCVKWFNNFRKQLILK